MGSRWISTTRMAPKQRWGNSFSPRGGGRRGGGFNRNQGWDRDGFQRRGWRQNNGGSGVGEKRPWNTKGDMSAQSKKRLKSNYSSFPLSTLMLANPGDKTGSLPELLLSGFYDCSREAKIGRQSHFFRININRKVYKGLKQKGVDPNKSSDAVSIPVPLENIEAVTVLPGMKDFKALLKAHSDRASLRVSYARWVKVIEKRTLAHSTKLAEFEKMPEIEEEPEAAAAEECEEPEQEEEEVESPMEVDNETAEVDPEEAQRKLAEKKEKLRLANERKKLADEKKRAERVKIEAVKKERALKIKERNLVKASVDNLAAAVEKANENLATDEEKLAELEAEFGQKLAFFQNETDDVDAEALFFEELQEGMLPIPEEEQEEVTEETEATSADATAEGDADADADETEKAAEGEIAEGGDTEMGEAAESTTEVTKSDICHECGASGVSKKRFCGECGAKQIDPADANKVNEVPVWMVVMLKKPLEKFYVSDTNTTICRKELP